MKKKRTYGTKKAILFLFLKGAGIGLGLSLLVAIASFYLFIVSGKVPAVQEIWITSAMTTLNHKWLATAFIDEHTILSVMERNKVDDSGHTTDPEMLKKEVIEEKEVVEVEEEKDPYPGYQLLEEGIYIKDIGELGWKGKLILVEDPSRVDLVQTRYQWERGDLIKTLVPLHEARLGVNAGGFVDGPNYDSNGSTPAGLLIINGKVINSSGNYKHSVIGLNEDNILILGKMTKQEALDARLRSAVDFRPFLIVNGEPMIKNGTGGWGLAPRTAIGQRPTGEILFMVVDGRRPTHSIGVDLKVLQDVLLQEGAINAAMLDGGSSTVAYHIEQGYLNRPSLGHERYINNCWIVTKK